jgi:hypothetical protein
MPPATRDKLLAGLVEILARPGAIPVSLALLIDYLPPHPQNKECLSAVLRQKISSSGLEVLGKGHDQKTILACLKRLGVEVADTVPSGHVFPKNLKPKVRQGSVNARAAWVETGGHGIRWVTQIGDQLWLVAMTPPGQQPPFHPGYTLGKVTLPEFRVEEVLSWKNEQPDSMDYYHDFPAFALLAGWIYSWEGQALCRRKIDGGQRETIPLPITGRPDLWAVNGRLYLGLDSGGVLRVDPETKAWELLADSKRRPAQGLLDDCLPYRVEHIWQDPRRGLCFMIDSVHTFDEKSRQWSGSRRIDYMSYKNPFDRTLALESLYDMANARGRDRSLTVQVLLGDMDRVGAMPNQHFDAGTYFGGQPQLENGFTQWNLIGYMVEKRDLWALFHHTLKPDSPPHLVWMPELPGETVAIEVRFPKEVLARIPAGSSQLQGGFAVGEPVRMISSRHGVAFYQARFPALWFISREDLAAAGVSRLGEP